MRLLADMGVSQTVAHWLQQAGHEALHLRDEGLQRLSSYAFILIADQPYCKESGLQKSQFKCVSA